MYTCRIIGHLGTGVSARKKIRVSHFGTGVAAKKMARLSHFQHHCSNLNGGTSQLWFIRIRPGQNRETSRFDTLINASDSLLSQFSHQFSQLSLIFFFALKHPIFPAFEHHFFRYTLCQKSIQASLCQTLYSTLLHSILLSPSIQKKIASDTLCQLSLRPTLLVPCNLVSVSLSLEHHYSIHSVKLSLRIVLLLARHCSRVKSQTSHHFCCTT